jgi:hypothetical protein
LQPRLDGRAFNFYGHPSAAARRVMERLVRDTDDLRLEMDDENGYTIRSRWLIILKLQRVGIFTHDTNYIL